ncbi:MAG TPA: flagellar motor protein MotB [Terracidiphilus sp.]|nr:flagellar motor protein MotB [Terracidiphilus sp.]
MSPIVPKSRVSHDRWLVSYADFITLLFAFFVVMYAFAKADQRKQVQVSESIDAAFRALGIFPDSARKQTHASTTSGTDRPEIPMNIVMGEDVLAPAQVKSDLERVQHDLEQTLSNEVATHTVSIRMGRDGLVISLREAGFFDTGSAAPKLQSLGALREIAERLGRTPYDVRIEGHTDNVPIHNSRFASNWELSAARATNIARVFLTLKAVPPERLSAAGYAEYHPVASNATPDGRAENRRVDLVVLPKTRTDFAGISRPASTAGGEWRKITDDDE